MNWKRQAAYLATILVLVAFITPHNASNEPQSFVEILDNFNAQFVREKKPTQMTKINNCYRHTDARVSSTQINQQARLVSRLA